MIERVAPRSRRLVLWAGFGLVAFAVVGAVLWSGPLRPGTGQSPPDRIALARASGKPVLVEFGADHCAACREMKGVLAELEASHGGQMVILDIDFGTPEGRRVLRAYGMQAIPTQLFFDNNGHETGRHLGALPAEAILTALGLDHD